MTADETVAKSNEFKESKWLLWVLRSLTRNRLALTGLVILSIFGLCAALAPLIAPHDPLAISLPDALQGPSWENLLGTDSVGRDILSMLIFGARISLTIGLIAVGIGTVIGAPLGAISGYYGGKVDLIIQRPTDITLAFPGILLAIVVVSILGVGLHNAMIAIGITFIPTYIRLIRGCVLSIKEEVYISAAKAVGASDLRIIFRHILPNCVAPIIVHSTLNMASAILQAAGLGFLGLGAMPPTPEWGAMLSGGRIFILHAPHVTIFPGLALALAVLGFNLLGDGLRDALDPRMKRH
jgi:ABC-type dipeptide/oligopeptide/nickel transport system permease subunit